ncbi:hypothetical protein ACFL4Q_02765 [candidate division KSB1 bacterium]
MNIKAKFLKDEVTGVLKPFLSLQIANANNQEQYFRTSALIDNYSNFNISPLHTIQNWDKANGERIQIVDHAENTLDLYVYNVIVELTQWRHEKERIIYETAWGFSEDIKANLISATDLQQHLGFEVNYYTKEMAIIKTPNELA